MCEVRGHLESRRQFLENAAGTARHGKRPKVEPDKGQVEAQGFNPQGVSGMHSGTPGFSPAFRDGGALEFGEG